MILRACLILLLITHSLSLPTATVIRNGSTYSLNGGYCEYFSCGSDEGRGLCFDEIYLGRAAYYCVCSSPFTGSFCSDVLPLIDPALSPYSTCPSPLHCATVYGNRECDQECDSPECLYDGYDCLPVCPEYCSDLLSNGVCDDVCNEEECQFDGGDCFSFQDTLKGQLLIRLIITAQDFMKISRLFLSQLSHFLRASILVSKDIEGPLIWEWSDEKGRGARIHKDENCSVGIEVAFSVSLTSCTTHCIDSIDMAVEMMAEILSSKSSPISSAQMVSVSSSHRPSRPPLLAIAAPLVLLVAIVGTIVHRRSRKRVLEAPVWTPPTYGEVASPARSLNRPRVSFPPSRLHLIAMSTDPLSVQEGEEVDIRDDSYRTPLLLSIQSDRREEELRETVSELLKAGADVNAVDRDGQGALHLSISNMRSPSFNHWLLSLGVNPLVVDSTGRTPLHIAVDCSDLPNLQLLLHRGADRIMDVADDSNRTALSISVCAGRVALTRCLLDRGADVNCDGEERFDRSLPRKKPIHIAVELRDKEHVLMLIRRGCRMNSLDHRQRTPLHYAALHADIHICRIVVDAGTPVDAVDDEDRTAEEMAEERGDTEIHEFLISVRGTNEPWKRKRDRKPKRYSSDQGYGSEESQLQPTRECNTPSRLTTPLTPLSTPLSHTVPSWTLEQLPFLKTGPFTEFPVMCNPLEDLSVSSCSIDPLNDS